jgi:aminopeptidase-like protein
MSDYTVIGRELHKWASELFPLNRSLTGEGTLHTLHYLKDLLPDLEIKSIESNSKVFDWTVPKEWNIRAGFIKNENGKILIDLKNNNLHVMSYSVSVNSRFTREQLAKNVHFLENQPDAIPYVTSYYKDAWAFCMTYNQWINLGDGPFEVVIDSEKINGFLNYAELYVPGKSEQEFLFSTYICHPSMANNELSGPVIQTKLLQKILENQDNKYSYRGVFIPETIGSLVYISKNLDSLRRNLIAGWVLTCLGDSGEFSYIPSRNGNTYADRITLDCFKQTNVPYKHYSWLDRGSDERQYCAPGIDLPVCSVTKTKYGEYNEYHTSLDDLNFISPEGLGQSLKFFENLYQTLEKNTTPRIKTLGEPQLGKRNLYPNTSIKGRMGSSDLTNIISYLDGQHNLSEISRICSLSTDFVTETIEILRKNDLV